MNEVFVVLAEAGDYEQRYEEVVGVAGTQEIADAIAADALELTKTTLYSDGVVCRESKVWESARIERVPFGVLVGSSSTSRLGMTSAEALEVKLSQDRRLVELYRDSAKVFFSSR